MWRTWDELFGKPPRTRGWKSKRVRWEGGAEPQRKTPPDPAQRLNGSRATWVDEHRARSPLGGKRTWRALGWARAGQRRRARPRGGTTKEGQMRGQLSHGSPSRAGADEGFVFFSLCRFLAREKGDKPFASLRSRYPPQLLSQLQTAPNPSSRVRISALRPPLRRANRHPTAKPRSAYFAEIGTTVVTGFTCETAFVSPP